MIVLDFKSIIIILLILTIIGIFIYNRYISSSENKKNKEYYADDPYFKDIPFSNRKTDYSESKNEVKNNEIVSAESSVKGTIALEQGMLPINLNVLENNLDTQYQIGGYQYTNSQPDQLYSTIVQNEPDLPNEEKVEEVFNSCIQKGYTVEQCLTESNSGLYPGLAKKLCQQYYPSQSPYCTRIAIKQIYQMNNSGSRGPA
jgi:hypothetical protein